MIKSELSRDEQRLLLYLETCLVDHNGIVNSGRISRDEYAVLKEWTDEGFIKWGRLPFKHIVHEGTHWVCFSKLAWKISASLRAERGERGFAQLNTRIGLVGA